MLPLSGVSDVSKGGGVAGLAYIHFAGDGTWYLQV